MSEPSSRPVSLTTSGPPETVLPDEGIDVVHPLRQAEGLHGPARRDAVAVVVAAHPRSLAAWAALGALGRDEVEAYAAYRVGYHRGLDILRSNGWRGSGYVRWQHASNRGFLSCLDGLRSSAEAIGEADEADRCAQFLHQLDPEWEQHS